MKLDSRIKKLETAILPSAIPKPYILHLKDGETLEEGKVREGIPDKENGYRTFVIGVSFV
jgi:hypothetical protein|tara:strand:+ start:580 stop:759 length:180 start_codon:yes stop_codon:yes gene_type:complete